MREDDHWMKHSFITRAPDGNTQLGYKPVIMGRYEPVERKY
jgi:succinate dehydrogenase / fumarate reductase, flavoprotein subunit